MIDISIDIETLADVPGAAIATIGGYAVSDTAGTPYMVGGVSEFYVVLNDETGIITPKTVRWHAKQSDPVGNLGGNPIDLRTGIQKFSIWLRRMNAHKEDTVRIWSHATFDMPIIAGAYHRLGLRPPWRYRDCRDLRTLYDLAGGRPEVGHGGKHNALEDAKAQMLEIQICLSRTRTQTERQDDNG